MITSDKLKLTKDDPNDLYDVQRVNANMDKLEAAVGLGIVANAAARIALPAAERWVNREVMDLDTQNTYVWDGTQWIRTNYWAAYVPPAAGVVNLTEAATIVTNFAQGRTFRVTVGANRSLGAPTNPIDGEIGTWEISASGGARTITLVLTAGGFKFGSSVTSWTAIASGTTDIMRAKYHQPSDRWRVLDIVKGF